MPLVLALGVGVANDDGDDEDDEDEEGGKKGEEEEEGSWAGAFGTVTPPLCQPLRICVHTLSHILSVRVKHRPEWRGGWSRWTVLPLTSIRFLCLSLRFHCVFSAFCSAQLRAQRDCDRDFLGFKPAH